VSHYTDCAIPPLIIVLILAAKVLGGRDLNLGLRGYGLFQDRYVLRSNNGIDGKLDYDLDILIRNSMWRGGKCHAEW
jgi:hypothetical protein